MPIMSRPAERMELRSLPSGPPSTGEHIFWQEVFSKLSYASYSHEPSNLNGNSIDLKKLEGYLRGASSFSLEQKTGLPRRKLLFILRNIKKADLNQDGLICEMEWETFVQNGKGAFFGGGGMANVARVFMYAPTFSCKPPTMFLLIISLIQIACFTLSVAIPETIGSSLEYGDRNWPVDSFLIYNPYRRYEAWRFVSYMFLHADYGHIGFNLLVQFLVGIPLEMSQLGWTGSLRVAFLYFCGVAFGSLGSSVTSPDTYLLGASAGVYALIAAHMATLILNWHEDGIIYAKRLRKSRNTDEPTPNDLNPVIRGLRLVFLIVFVVVDVGQIVYKVYFLGRPGNTSYTGHAYGALTGLITGIFILENRKVEDWERWIEWSALILFALGLCALILVHIVNPGFFPEQDYSGLA